MAITFPCTALLALQATCLQVGGVSSIAGGTAGGPMTDSARELADEIAAWMGVGGVFVSGGKAGALNGVQTAPGQRS